MKGGNARRLPPPTAPCPKSITLLFTPFHQLLLFIWIIFIPFHQFLLLFIRNGFEKFRRHEGRGGNSTEWRVTGKRLIEEQRRGNAPNDNVFCEYNVSYNNRQRRGNAPNYNVFYNIIYFITTGKGEEKRACRSSCTTAAPCAPPPPSTIASRVCRRLHHYKNYLYIYIIIRDI